jgi:hypothetical protein
MMTIGYITVEQSKANIFAKDKIAFLEVKVTELKVKGL